MIIDTSNAPCGPGFLPGLRLSEGRFAINRKKRRKSLPFSAAGAVAGARRLRPPKCRLSLFFRGCPFLTVSPTVGNSSSALSFFLLLLRLAGGRTPPVGPARVGRGCRWTDFVSVLPASRTSVRGSPAWTAVPSWGGKGERLLSARGSARCRLSPTESERASLSPSLSVSVSLSPRGLGCVGAVGRPREPRQTFFDYDLRSDETTR